MLHDQLVSGINNKDVQWCLLSELPLLCEKAMSLAQGLEFVAQNVKRVAGRSSG